MSVPIFLMTSCYRALKLGIPSFLTLTSNSYAVKGKIIEIIYKYLTGYFSRSILSHQLHWNHPSQTSAQHRQYRPNSTKPSCSWRGTPTHWHRYLLMPVHVYPDKSHNTFYHGGRPRYFGQHLDFLGSKCFSFTWMVMVGTFLR
jgi:hypothetical protein